MVTMEQKNQHHLVRTAIVGLRTARGVCVLCVHICMHRWSGGTGVRAMDDAGVNMRAVLPVTVMRPG